VVRSDSKINEDMERKIKREGRDLKRERERNKRDSVGVRRCCGFFLNAVTQTTSKLLL